jgi:hypothetical protein
MDLLKCEAMTINGIIALAIIFILYYIVIFHLDLCIGDENSKFVHSYTETCVVGCKTSKPLCELTNGLRSNGYYLFGDYDKCIVSWWEISHVTLHMWLGYFTNIYVSQTVSVGFELYEHFALGCGSFLDLLYNFLGFAIGNQLRYGGKNNQYLT